MRGGWRTWGRDLYSFGIESVHAFDVSPYSFSRAFQTGHHFPCQCMILPMVVSGFFRACLQSGQCSQRKAMIFCSLDMRVSPFHGTSSGMQVPLKQEQVFEKKNSTREKAEIQRGPGSCTWTTTVRSSVRMISVLPRELPSRTSRVYLISGTCHRTVRPWISVF